MDVRKATGASISNETQFPTHDLLEKISETSDGCFSQIDSKELPPALHHPSQSDDEEGDDDGDGEYEDSVVAIKNHRITGGGKVLQLHVLWKRDGLRWDLAELLLFDFPELVKAYVKENSELAPLFKDPRMKELAPQAVAVSHLSRFDSFT